ncbi:MAG: hypothetical protein OEQ12_04195 [Nitrosopumilus sp.]|nr:hypothetical protein [Nitrosopumilus sp.]
MANASSNESGVTRITMMKNSINSKTTFAILISAILTIGLTSVVYAEQVPAAVLSVETNPNYFSEGGLGIGILMFFDRPLAPYLVPGQTTEESSLQEIYQAYVENFKVSGKPAIVNDNDRATVFVTEFSNGDIAEPLVFNTFTKFTHLARETPTNYPYYYDGIGEGFELESLPSLDKKSYYDILVQPYINPGKAPEPFDVTIKFLTGDGDTLQIWKYTSCNIIAYTPYLDENLGKVKFVGAFTSEIRDKTTLSCDGFGQDFVLIQALEKPDSLLAPVLPENEDKVTKIAVQFSGGEFPFASTFYSFSKFLPIVRDPDIPIAIPGNVIGEKPLFLLESHPTKDKQGFYQQISRYINVGKEPEPFDTTIHLVTGGGVILQSWKYSDCDAYNHSVYFVDNLFFFKFKQSFGSEIREKTFFECNGLELNPEKIESIDTSIKYTPDDFSRAQVFSVKFEGADINPAKTINSFTRYSPISHEEKSLLIANAPFNDLPKFYLSSLPSAENEWYYQLIDRYINAGSIPEDFDVTVDVLVGDGTRIQSWKYTTCEILEYKQFLEDVLATRKYTKTFDSEIRDRTIFQCTGLQMDGNSIAPESVPVKPFDSVDFIPSDENRVKKVVATFSGGELTEPFTINTIGKFKPEMEQRRETTTMFMSLNVAIKPVEESGDPEPSEPIEPPPSEPEEPGSPGTAFTVHIDEPHISTAEKNDYIKSTEFYIESLPTKDKVQYYDLVERSINPGKAPEPFDVQFDFVTGDGTILQSWKYVDCKIEDFQINFRDSLLYFTFSGAKGASDIVDESKLTCNGFHVSSDQQKFKGDIASKPPTAHDRAMIHVVSWYGGEIANGKTTALVQEFETLSDSSFFAGGLPNIYHKNVYDFIEMYVNPEKDPEPINFRIDSLTGDGTILYSTVYTDCTATDATVYLSDTMAILRYVPGLESEIRGQAIVECEGVKFKTMPHEDWKLLKTSGLKKISPFVQKAIGVESGDVVCSDGLTLMIRPPKNIPVCMKDDHTSKLEERGWVVASPSDNKLVDFLRPILVSEPERAKSFTVNFEGTDIAPPQTVETFSNFVPIKDPSNQNPSNPLTSDAVSFYLESLSSTDKTWYYEFTSRYVNPGAVPEEFNVSVQVKDGAGDVLQTWNYSDCEIFDFVTYYDDALLKWKFHDKWQSEFKDKSVFTCAGLSLT